MTVKDGSQLALILNALKDGRWTSSAEIHRRAGTRRVSDLRRYGYTIQHRTVPGDRGSLRHQYRLVNPPLPLPDPGPSPVERNPLDRDKTPRDKAHKFRVYIVDEKNELLLMAAVPTEEQVGVAICELGRSGVVGNSCVGVQETFGEDTKKNPGKWIINPWGPKTI